MTEASLIQAFYSYVTLGQQTQSDDESSILPGWSKVTSFDQMKKLIDEHWGWENEQTVWLLENIILQHLQPKGTQTVDLDELLERWTVLGPGMWENDTGPKGWYAVSSDDGIIAYFAGKDDAFRFRLAEINRVLNG